MLTCWSVLLFPQERVAASKTLAKDASLTVDPCWMKWWEKVLPELARGDAKQRVWKFSYAELVPVFKAAATSIGLPSLVPYQARHSGASIDSA